MNNEFSCFFPQIYMDGEFVGGCDILLQMHQSGELGML
jgi:monothiol glutaredoxin